MRSAHLTAVMAAALLLGAGTGAPARTLEAELAHLLVDHPQIKAAEKTLESTRQEIDKSFAGFLPRLTADADIGHEVIDSPSERSSRPGAEPFSRTRNTARLTLTQNLFNGYSSTSALRTARLNSAASRTTLDETRQSVLFAGIRAYVEVLRQKRLIALQRLTEQTIQRQLNLEDERVQRGSGIAVDVLQAKSRLQIAKERRITFEGALQDAVSRYLQVFNHAPDIEAMMDPAPPIGLIPASLPMAVDVAVVENPAIGTSAATAEAARENRRSVKSELFPSMDIVGKWNYEKHDNAVIGTRRDYSVVVQATWDLFTGFSTRASMAQAAFDYRASKDNETFVHRGVVEQTRFAWQALETARKRLELLENAVNIAAEVFVSRKKLREAGKETVINVLDSENEVNNAKINFTIATYDERIATYQLLLAMGRLNAAYLNLEQIQMIETR